MPPWTVLLLLLLSLTGCTETFAPRTTTGARLRPRRFSRSVVHRSPRLYRPALHGLREEGIFGGGGDRCSLEYSFNFRRHIVRKNGQVIESYLWYDEARQRHPDAETLPITVVAVSDFGIQDPGPLLDIFGASTEEASRYKTVAVSPEDNRARLSHILLDRLKWFPQQIDRFLGRSVGLKPDVGSSSLTVAESYPAPYLQERLDFLLAPMVPVTSDPDLGALYGDPHLSSSSSSRRNGTSRSRRDDSYYSYYDRLVERPVDWPRWLYREGRGAGMTIAQVSHALHTVPFEILGPPVLVAAAGHNSNRTGPRGAARPGGAGAMDPTLLAFLYDQTPAVVMDMTPKQLDPRMSGVTTLACASVAYLHWKGWEWTTCRVVVDAIHSFSSLGGGFTTDAAADWDRAAARGRDRGGGNNNGGGRSTLEHVQRRLQLSPWQIRAVVRTHPKLAGYSGTLVEASIDTTLRRRLGFTSAQVRRIVLQMPSLLGVSEAAIANRTEFWVRNVGLTMDQLRDAVLGDQKRPGKARLSPSLLAYSSENLHAKLHFFQDVLMIPPKDMIRMTISHPDLWGRSLDGHYQPLVDQFCRRLSLTEPEFGRSIASRAPYILKCHWRTVCVKMDFLQNRLGLSDGDLRRVVETAPMLLLSSLREMEVKLEMLANVATRKSTIRTLIVNNPSLLQKSKALFEKRLNRVGGDGDESLLVALGGTIRRARDGEGSQRARRAVWLLKDEDERGEATPPGEGAKNALAVQAEFSSVGDAAAHAGVSTPTMYRLLRPGLARKSGNLYAYADSTPHEDIVKESPVTSNHGTTGGDTDQCHGQDDSQVRTKPFIICAASRAFPATRTVRGHRRGGGMALYVPGWTSDEWKAVALRVWKGQEDRMRLLKNGCLVLGYPYTRPSQRRCSLYVAREALRVAMETATLNAGYRHQDVVVVTDSHYVLDLLRNATRVVEWGEAETAATFQYDGPLKRFQANVDILYPLSRTWFNLAKRNFTVSFALSADFPEVPFDSLADGARLAAKHMFEQV